ncbi:hypothetical protein D3C73_604560 [compost metagenome]
MQAPLKLCRISGLQLIDHNEHVGSNIDDISFCLGQGSCICSSSVTDCSIKIRMGDKAGYFSIRIHISERLTLFPIMGNCIRCKCLLVVIKIMRAEVIVINSSFNSKRFTERIEDETILICMAMTEAAIRTRLHIERNTVGVI